MPRYMILMKASEQSEAGVMPSTELLEEMGAFNAELIEAGVLLAGEGLTASKEGARIRFEADRPPVVLDGPFAETKELIAGFWILQVTSREEAIEWIKRVPNTDGAHHEIEIRRVLDPEDFAPNATPELIEQERALREKAERNQS